MFTEWKALLLGIIQGLTEFLPVSSSGHLYLFRHLFGLDEAGLVLDTLLHTGTLIALLVFYRIEIRNLLLHPFTRLTLLICVGTIPAVIVGILFNDFFDEIARSGITVGWEFIITGIVLAFAEKKISYSKSITDITILQAIFIGCFQALAIFPAISRSGFTLAAGLFVGLKRETAAYFSFFLSIPVIFGGILFQAKTLAQSPVESISFQGLLIGTISAAIFGYLSVAWMINYMKEKSLKPFSIYVITLGIFILIFQLIGIF